ncbi:glycosyltransferase family 4 protein [Modicisalibacter tunisiensis]|uniref:glycosyltransferase family 4 protein n=1 Tax=Modicisalibacter tunisiensis TaxID=390637 RepID=UPI001CC96F26|nr:glycosyltransferase family 4 protein [Modicisalibacter tunisiensis]MBZ9540436.1 glycosyltransferase family 4 protein [Modicisalibacter tunisiensis]
MRVLVTATHVPFMSGGAEAHIQGVGDALRRAGHSVETLRLPFRFSPESDIQRLMDYTETLDFTAPNGLTIDKAVSLQFPTYGISHPDHTVWVMHQHRAVYELWDDAAANDAQRQLRRAIHAYDERHLARAQRLFANSPRVAERLATYNGLSAEPLSHPPPGAERLRHDEDWGYVFYPSRLESLKRQDLLIEAARHLTSPVKILLGGEGGQQERFARLIERHGLGDRVRLMGRISDAEKIACYAHALAVFFGPFDEDYGYVTLEAMLAGKPVITCTDSGGPLAFVEHGETGWVTEPQPEAIAAAIDDAWQHRARSRDMGLAGQAAYHQAGISWDNVVARLVG